jgi:hypothetical protein
MGMDMGMGGAFGGAMHDAAAMGGGALGEMGNDAAMMGGLQDAASSYAGPTGMPNGTMGTNPMDGDKVMEKMGDLATRKKKKNPMDMGDMDYAGPESPQGFEGMAGNTFSKEGLDKMNQHYAQTQQSMAAG